MLFLNVLLLHFQSMSHLQLSPAVLYRAAIMYEMMATCSHDYNHEFFTTITITIYITIL
jgi:hypothetical protein